MSLDGYIADPDGEFDWIGVDPDMSCSVGAFLLSRSCPKRIGLTLTEQRVFEKTGTVSPVYEVKQVP